MNLYKISWSWRDSDGSPHFEAVHVVAPDSHIAVAAFVKRHGEEKSYRVEIDETKLLGVFRSLTETLQ